ncbi:MAG: hypothetical protein WC784_02945 [Candidatus Shapirobacteria bacterium]|jgi:hypothetical protein
MTKFSDIPKPNISDKKVDINLSKIDSKRIYGEAIKVAKEGEKIREAINKSRIENYHGINIGI